MLTSTRGTTGSRGFTLVELSIVLFVLGLVLWTVAPRLARFGETSREAVFRDLASGSEQAFDISLFEKRETRLVLLPSAGTYEFRRQDNNAVAQEPQPKELGARLKVTGILVEGEDRPLDIPTEIRYLPGGRVPDTRIFIRDAGDGREPTDWTLRLNPWDGTIRILEGKVMENG